MVKKKFIDKKRSATFQLLARDTSSLPDADDASASDRVFVRVDSNDYDVHFSLAEDDAPSERVAGPLDSVFADAPSDNAEDPARLPWVAPGGLAGSSCAVCPHGGAALPGHIRREILELGLPDDGYNYLVHLREIRHAGGGAAYYDNQRARMDLVPVDVKAYDASRVRVSAGVDREEASAVCTVASRTVGARVQKAVDPDVARLLDEGELSMFGSDVEDLEEDFVIKANMPEGVGDDEEMDREEEYGSISVVKSKNAGVVEWLEGIEGGFGEEGCENIGEHGQMTGPGKEGNAYLGGDNQRSRRPLDVQFDLLELREYNSDGDNDDEYVDDEGCSLAAKLNDALKDYPVEGLELEIQDKYKFPGDFVRLEKALNDSDLTKTSAEIIQKCTEYAEKYSQEDPSREEMLVVEESSDESEVWDCETIVSTYTNLDNHPGKIQAPDRLRKKLPQPSADSKSDIITLRGKEKLPVDFLPTSKRAAIGKMKDHTTSNPQLQLLIKRPRDESKEEKKLRKASVKEEKRVARQTKKEFKGLYKGEAQRAQKVAALTGPSSIHLM